MRRHECRARRPRLASRDVPTRASPRAPRAARRPRRARRAGATQLPRRPALSLRQYRVHVASERAWLGVADATGDPRQRALDVPRRGAGGAAVFDRRSQPAARGGGLGRGCSRAAEREARAAGRSRCRLEVRAGNAAAIALYERAGYSASVESGRYYEDGAAMRLRYTAARCRET